MHVLYTFSAFSAFFTSYHLCRKVRLPYLSCFSCQLLFSHYKLRTLYGSLYLLHYLYHMYAIGMQDVSLFLHSSPCVRPIFPLVSSIPIKGCPPGLIYACSGNVCENDQISDGTGPGCYCTSNVYLYQKDGTCLNPTDSQCQSVNLCNNSCVCTDF